MDIYTKNNFKLDKYLINKKNKGLIREIIEILIFLIIVVIIFRLFLIETYTITSDSMYPNLKIQERILVSKFYYNIRIPFINKTFSGIDKPKRGSVIIFQHPDYRHIDVIWEFLNLITLGIFNVDNNINNERIMIKRCIGTPGDTVIIDNHKNIYINGEKLKKELIQIIENRKLYSENNSDKNYIITEIIEKYPTIKYIPSYYIPMKGDKLSIKKVEIEFNNLLRNRYIYKLNERIIETETLYLYSKIFSQEMGINLSNLKESYYEHIVENNYYFSMGDNRDNSVDSRNWGFVREDLIFGNPLLRYYPIYRFNIIK